MRILISMVAGMMFFLPPRLMANTFFSDGLAAVPANGKIGYINKRGAWVIKPRFVAPQSDMIIIPKLLSFHFHEGLACVGIKKKCGYINKKGIFVIKPAYDYGLQFSEGLAAVRVKGKWGFIDRSGQMVIEPKYDHGGYHMSFGNGLAWVRLHGKWGIIDKKGTTVVNHLFDSLVPLEGTPYIRVFKNKKAGIVNSFQGEIIIEPEYDEVGLDDNDMFLVKQKGKWGLIDNKGSVVVKPQYDRIDGFNEGRARVQLNGKYGYISAQGRLIVKPRYEEARSFYEGLAAVKENNLWGYIGRDGDMAIKPQFDRVTSFSQGEAYARIPGGSISWYIINKKGTIDRKRSYSFLYLKNIRRFNSNGLFIVELVLPGNNNFPSRYFQGIINRDGKRIVNTEYTNINNRSKYGLYLSYKKRRPEDFGSGNTTELLDFYGVIDSRGKIIIDSGTAYRYLGKRRVIIPQYHYLIIQKEFLLLYQKDRFMQHEKFGLADHAGNVILKPVYDMIGSYSEGLMAVYKNNLLGFVNKDGKFIIPLKFKVPITYGRGK